MKLEQLVEGFEGRRVVVLGDLVADVSVYGEISRVSREAPVLILSHREKRLAPGGGANAVHNLWALGAKPMPVGMVGDDAEGRQIVEYFASRGIDVNGIRKAARYRTPTKTRILAGAPHSYRQQVLRIDEGHTLDASSTPKATLRAVKSRLRKADAVLISDYGYGIVGPSVSETFRNSGIPVTVDSRFRVEQFRNLTAATPNEPEVEAALGFRIGSDLGRLERAGRTLLRRLKHKAVLITRGKDGMALFEKGRKTSHVPIYGTDEITDVTGAGDTVIAVFTLALAAGASFIEAARLANYAGGIVVMKHGTRTVTQKELLEAVRADR